jgi:hypothetical protein
MEEDERKILIDDDKVLFIDVQQASDIEKYAQDDIKKELIDDWVRSWRDNGDFYIIVDKRYSGNTHYLYRDNRGDTTYWNEYFDEVTYSEFVESLNFYRMNSAAEYVNEHLSSYGDTYQLLIDIKNGKKFDRYVDFSDYDELIYRIELKEKNTAKSIIQIRFEDEQQYCSLFDGLNDDDKWFISMLFSYYDGYEFKDGYSTDDDWNEGYLLRGFSQENIDKVREILKYTNPNLVNFDSTDDDACREVSVFLNNLDSNRISYITGEYTSLFNDSANKAAKQEITNDLCNVLTPYYFITKNCMSDYFTSVGLLLKLYDRYGNPDMTILDLLQTIGKTMTNISGGYYEYSYEYGYNNFDDNAFNQEVSNNLDKMLEDILEDYDDSKQEIYNNVIAKYGLDKRHKIPTSEDESFKIVRIDDETGKIVISKFKTSDPWNTQEEHSYTLEEFNSFLNNYKLFESKRIKNIIREQLENVENKEVLNFLKDLPPITEMTPLKTLNKTLNNYNQQSTQPDINLKDVLKATSTPSFPFKLKLELNGVVVNDVQKVIKSLSYEINPNLTFTLTVNPVWKKTLPGVNIKF